MPDPIRPPLTPGLPASPQRNARAMEAQRAFFQAALGKTAPPAAAAPAQTARPAAPASASRTAQQTTASAEPAPVRYARPGSKLDIKV